MAVFNMAKPAQRPVGNPAIGYNSSAEMAGKPSYAAYNKPQDQSKPIKQPPGNSVFGYNQTPNTKPVQGYSKPIGPNQSSGALGVGGSKLPWWYRRDQELPPQQITPIGPSVQMQAKPVGQFYGGGGGYAGGPIGGAFTGGGSADQGRLAAALQRLFGY